MDRFDVVVIGSGVGGGSVARALKNAGKRVALIENDAWGGTCPNRGCDPKKVLAASGEALDHVTQLTSRGIVSEAHIDWPELMAFKRTFTDPFPSAFEQGVRKIGIETFSGTARFTSPREIEVDGSPLTADTFVIATGQQPHIMEIEGNKHFKTSNDFLDFDEMPSSIAFLGAGYIAFELASIAHAAGSEVTIVHHNDRPLKGFDGSLVADLVAELRNKGITIDFDIDITRLVEKNGGYVLEGDSYTREVACVVCATGREPNIAALNLNAAGISHSPHGIIVDDHLRTTNEAVFACGDVLEKRVPKLTPVASFEGRYLADVILGKTSAPISYPAITSIVFSSPKLAHVGISIDEAEEHPERYTIDTIDMSGWFTYRHRGDSLSKARLIRDNGMLVGASVLSNHADELINYLAIALNAHLGKADIEAMVLGSPTIASDMPYLL